MLRLVRRRSVTQVRLLLLGHCFHNRLANSYRFTCLHILLVIRCSECLRNAAGIGQPSCRRVHTKQAPVSHCLERVWEPVDEIHHWSMLFAECEGV